MKTRLETPPVDVMITTISTCGWSSSTSMWRIVVVWIGGAETIDIRSVTCASVSEVSRSASSTSRRASVSVMSARAGSGSRRST